MHFPAPTQSPDSIVHEGVFIMLKLLTLLFLPLLLFPAALAEEEAVSPFTTQMLERSLVSIGNTSRMHAAMEKARRGEEVTIVYLGGSITEGAQAQPQPTHCYAYLSARAFAERFMADRSQPRYINAGISGTPSVLGIARLEQDVLVHQPDIVFVEFAVNDSNQPVPRTIYESMVRKLLAAPSQTAVVLLFTFTESGYSCQPHMQQIGKHYDLPMISVKDALQPAIMLKQITWRDYSSDYTHPNNAGHAFIAQMIDNYFAQAAATPAAPWTMAEEAKYGKAYETLLNIREGDAALASKGSFVWMPDRCYSYTQGWKHLASTGNKPLTLSLSCSRLIIAYKQERTGRGACEVWVDGTLIRTLPGSTDGAWGNIATEYIELGDVSAPHTIEFRMADKDVLKPFTLLDISYVP